MRDGDKHFVLHWKGTPEDQHVYGRNIAEACNNAGIGAGALPALDYWEQVKTENATGETDEHAHERSVEGEGI